MTTKLSSIGLMILCTFFTSLAQVLYKFGVAKLEFNFISIITNYQIIAGIACYGIGAVILIAALRGGEVSILYPIVATSYIWVSLMSVQFFNEVMNIYKWAGVFFIIAGIIILNLKGRQKALMQYAEPI